MATSNSPGRGPAVPDTDTRGKLEAVLDSAMTPQQRFRTLATQAITAIVIVAILYWSAIDTNVSLGEFVRGIPAIVESLGRMFPRTGGTRRPS